MFDIHPIKQNIINSPRVIDLSDNDLKKLITSACMTIFALSGAAKNLSVDQYKDELTIIVTELESDIKNEFSSLRVSELLYAFKLGHKDYLPVKTFGINYKTFYTWLDCYYKSEIRQQAIYAIENEKPKLQLEQKCELTTAEIDSIMQNAINTAYTDFLNIEDKSKIKIITEPKYVFGALKSGNLTDINNIKINYLRSQGLIKNNETLLTFFNACLKKGLKKIF